jgi:uncharacterized membrane protein YeiH
MDLPFIEIIIILSTLAFAISATSSAMRKHLDIFGIVIIAFVGSVGGGTLRDILIGNTPVSWLQNTTIINTVVVGMLLTLLVNRKLKKINYTLFIFDAIGLGLSTIVGVQKGMDMHFVPGVCVALGAVTGCFGGVIRDILLNEIPLIFRKEIYASVSIAGGIIFYAFTYFNFNEKFSQLFCIIFIVVVRVVVVKYKLSLPSVYVGSNKDI